MTLKITFSAIAIFLQSLILAQPAHFIFPKNIAKVNDMVQHADTLWLATDSGIVKLNIIDESKQYFHTNEQFNRVILDNNNIWAASHTNGLHQYTSGSWTNYTTQSGLLSNQINDMAIDKNGKLWLATSNGISEQNGTNFSTHLPFSNNEISAVACFGDTVVAGNLFGEPLAILNSGSWTNLPAHNSPGQITRQLFIDQDGVIYKYSIYGFHKLDGLSWQLAAPSNLYNCVISTSGNYPVCIGSPHDDAYLKSPTSWIYLKDFLHTSNSIVPKDIQAVARTKNNSFWTALQVENQLVLAHYFYLPNNDGFKKLSTNALNAPLWADCYLFNAGRDDTLAHALKYLDKSLVYSGFLKISGWAGSRQNRTTIAQKYISTATPNFVAGPISNQRHKKSFYEKYYNVWHVSKAEIEIHKTQYQNPNYTAPGSILNWPGNGDVAAGEAQFIAPFVDQNFNGIYEPMMGDYPDILGDEAVFSIGNSANGFAPNQGHINAEIHTMMYAYDSVGTPLHHTVFVKQKINFYNQNFDTLIVGQFIDFDLGNFADDFSGCDSTKNLAFAYNGDYDDDGPQGFGVNPPATGFMTLNNPMGGFVANNAVAGTAPSGELFTFQTLNSLWSDGTKMRVENPSGFLNSQNGDGHGAAITDPITKFQYNAALGWYKGQAGFADARTHAMQYFYNITPGREICFTNAFLVARDSSTSGGLAASLGQLFANADWIQNFYNGQNDACMGAEMNFLENTQSQNWSVGPNPSSGIFVLNAKNDFKNAHFQVLNSTGQIVSNSKITTATTHINLSNLPNGIYLLQVLNGANKSFTERLVVAH